MASIILKNYLSSDIIDYCIDPYLIITEENVKKNRMAVIEELKKILLITKLLSTRHNKSNSLLPSDMKSKYIGLGKWCLAYHNHINQQIGKKLIY